MVVVVVVVVRRGGVRCWGGGGGWLVLCIGIFLLLFGLNPFPTGGNQGNQGNFKKRESSIVPCTDSGVWEGEGVLGSGNAEITTLEWRKTLAIRACILIQAKQPGGQCFGV